MVKMPLTFINGKFVLEGGSTVPIYVFELLETLPKLSDLVFEDFTAWIRLQDLHSRIAQKTALCSLSFSVEYPSVVSRGLQIADGPEGLKSISVKWETIDASWDGNPLGRLYEFLRPSLRTLMHLELHGRPSIHDFQVFGPTCTSLRTLKYRTYSPRAVKVLEAIAEMFPNITSLEILLFACS